MTMSQHPVLRAGHVAVITGGASGIGLAAARRLATFGLKVCLADLPGDRLDEALACVRAGAADPAAIMAVATDVSQIEALRDLETKVRASLGEVNVLMNNAGIQPGSQILSAANWARIIEVNLWGVIRGTQAFVPGMLASRRPGLIINTGSKQGITTPPGDPAYNVSKAGVKVFTEALQHELRTIPGCAISAHLLIPGFVFTPLTAHGRSEKPAGAWTPEQTIAFMLERLAHRDFYILCPDHDVDRALDARRIAWSAGDIIENRPPLSRWHPDFAEKFKTSLRES
jgi:NAD(P)-dependent dehydrogenase (short-subunit alcohol dehydrogenase family)